MADLHTEHLIFAENADLPHLFGEQDVHLKLIEEALDVDISYRGNQLAIRGEESSVVAAKTTLLALLEKIEKKQNVDPGEVKAALRMVGRVPDSKKEAKKLEASKADYQDDQLGITTRKRKITPRTPHQADYLRALRTHELVFGLGPAGTGKTYLAVAMGVTMLLEGKVERIILSRPAVEAGERLGFLPGDLKEKIDPYLRPLYDALYDMIPGDQLANRLASNEIEIAPLAFMRGRTLANAFVILDEAQNTTPVQMKMLLTRLGENSRMVITGDMTQVDLPRGTYSGLRDAVRTLRGLPQISFIKFTEKDVVRHPLVAAIVGAYDKQAKKTRQGAEYEGREGLFDKKDDDEII